MKTTRNEALTFVNAVLGIWLGIHAFRTFVPAAAWNLSDALPLSAKGAIAIAVHMAGLAGCVLPFTRNARSAARLAVLVGLVSVLRQVFLGSDVAGSALSLLGWILWLWWFAAFTRTHLARHAQLIAPALAAGFALQVAVQTAFHGLDLPMARGPAAVACATLIGVLFVTSAFTAAADDADAGTGSIGLIAFGAAFFLEITLLANVGRIGFMSDLALTPSALLIEAGLIGGLLLLALQLNRGLLLIGMMALVVIVALAIRLSGNAVLLFAVAQIAMLALLHAAAMRRTGSHRLTFAGGAVLLFVLVFLFYNHYEWPALWTIAALAVAACALPHAPWVAVSHRFAAVGFVAALLTLGAMAAPTPRTAGARGTKLLTYNIHQGFDAAGAPAMQRIADQIQAFDADVIALQEVGRGWTLLGGSDLIAYLKYRFPDYRMSYVPLNGQLLGVALLTRLPARFGPGVVFRSAPGVFRYGYAQADIRLGARNVHFVAVHLTAGLEGNGGTGRADQMTQLLTAQQLQADIAIMGDFNAQPNDPPVRQILSSGFRDAAAMVGLGDIATWPAGQPYERDDYVFLRGSVQPLRGAIVRTTASDHLPLLMTLK
ncbi:MAG TPA: endonuclease/exonuclease/phosphatase family protein [Longimicrobiales bacterium]